MLGLVLAQFGDNGPEICLGIGGEEKVVSNFLEHISKLTNIGNIRVIRKFLFCGTWLGRLNICPTWALHVQWLILSLN